MTNKFNGVQAFFSCALLLAGIHLHAAASAGRIELERCWHLQSSCKVDASGDVISSKSFQPKGWYSTSVPSTVFAAQVKSGEFKEPYFGVNLRKVPGMDYPIGDIYPNIEMPKTSPYACSWWYRTEFSVPANDKGRRLWLNFKGINYRANIWINGRKLADSKDVAGAYRMYEFDATSYLTPGQENGLAVEVFAPTATDLGINFVDWNPAPPDKDMGLWQEVFIATSGPVTVRYPQAVTHFPGKSLDEADLTVMAELHNTSDQPVQGEVQAEVDKAQLRQQISLAPGESRTVTFTPEQFSELHVRNPKLWWPLFMGSPTLHDLTVRFSTGGAVSDQRHARFGIREITSELTEKGHRLFRINGKPILIRGAAWTPDLMLRPYSHQQLAEHFDYVRHMNLNTIRQEGKLETDEFYDLADERGILIFAGWCCCDHWEQWDKWKPGDLEIATASLRSQILRLRSHPSLLVWLNGSDGPPPANVETAYLKVLKEVAWPNPSVSSAADTPTTVTGSSGVKMTGPYDYVPPSYWFVDKKFGGAHGFNTETSPGPAIPVKGCLKKFLPEDHLWPVDFVWNFHAAGERFMTFDPLRKAMDATYGPPRNLDDFERKAQAMAYDGERAMFEAYGGSKYTATGVIQWMLNNAWPSTFWHLYDYYMQPAGGYFGTKKANEPLHIQYSYKDNTVQVVNSYYEPFSGLQAVVNLYNTDLKEVFAKKMDVQVDSDSFKSIVDLPPLAENSGVYFLKLSLHNSAGKEVSSNFYWLPSRLSVISFDQTTDTNYSPVEKYEDLTALDHLPRVRVNAAAKMIGEREVRVTLHNPGKHLAFQVQLAINKESGDEILPVLWEDNYLELMPGETRVLTARYDTPAKAARLKLDGWNVEPVTVEVAAPVTQAKK